jgi:XTP/dITP diphosphohydrolase
MTAPNNIAQGDNLPARAALRLHGRLVIASHNEGKVREIGDLLAPFGMKTVSAGSLGLAEPEETGTTFVANARLKAAAAARASGLPALADDSGLAVYALGGQPGIHSARWAEPVPGARRDFDHAMRRVAEALDYLGARDRRARFICALVLAVPDRDGGLSMCDFEGLVEGVIVWPPRGDKGFGYDPVFQPCGFDITFGEMDPSRKHSMSHRAAAFRQLVETCFE